MLGCAANVAKILWPNPKDKDRKHVLRTRGTQLRRALGINRLSPLYPRAVRDGYEHIDERLDPWFKKAGNYLDLIIGPPDTGLAMHGFTVLRHFDPTTGLVRVFDKTANLDKIVQVLRELLPRAASRSRLWTA